MSDLDTTAALARAQAALANASAAVATLAQTVVDLHREHERAVAAQQKTFERRDRELDRLENDVRRRLASIEQREQEAAQLTPAKADLRRSYRRGYETGYGRGRAGRPSDVEGALEHGHNALRLAS